MQFYNYPYTRRFVNWGFKKIQIYNSVSDGVKNNAIQNQEGGQGTQIGDNIFTNVVPHVAIS